MVSRLAADPAQRKPLSQANGQIPNMFLDIKFIDEDSDDPDHDAKETNEVKLDDLSPRCPPDEAAITETTDLMPNTADHRVGVPNDVRVIIQEENNVVCGNSRRESVKSTKSTFSTIRNSLKIRRRSRELPDIDEKWWFSKQCYYVGYASMYLLLALIATVVTYSMIANLVTAMNHPVRSVIFKQVEEHDAPGIAIYPGGAMFPACNHYFQNVVTSKVKLSQLDLINRNCTFINMSYVDPHYPQITRHAYLIRGPSKVLDREAIFLHFQLQDHTRDFFTVSYFVFPNWDQFNSSDLAGKMEMLKSWHKKVPTFALSAGFRFWTKLSVKETHFFDGSKHTEFRTEYSVVRHWDRRPHEERKEKHLFFIFFEWKNNLVEQSFALYTTTPWNIGAGLCGVFLTLHKAYTLVQASVQKMKQRRRRKKEQVQ